MGGESNPPNGGVERHSEPSAAVAIVVPGRAGRVACRHAGGRNDHLVSARCTCLAIAPACMRRPPSTLVTVACSIQVLRAGRYRRLCHRAEQ